MIGFFFFFLFNSYYILPQTVKLFTMFYAKLKIFFIQRKYQEQNKEKGIIKLEEPLVTTYFNPLLIQIVTE